MNQTLLAIFAFSMITVFMILVMTKRLSALVALIVVPTVFGLLGGFYQDLGGMMMSGIRAIAPTGVMLLFAVLYFSLMIDTGLFDPVVRKVVSLVQGDPVKIVIGTAVLTLFVSLDGDGATTYLIVTAAMLPLYERFGISRTVLACVIMQAGGVMNILPWGGPTARAATALHLETNQVFVPMIPAMLVAALGVILSAYILGRRERKRIGVVPEVPTVVAPAGNVPGGSRGKFYVNFFLTVALLVGLVAGVMPLPVLFMVATAMALAINFPTIEQQRDRLALHAGNALSISAVIFAAGVLTGILSGTKMVDAMANSVIALVPEGMGPHFAVITGLLSMPFTFFLSNDAFYFGVLPILNQAAASYGISAAEMARASVIGQPVHLLSPLVPSTYLLVGLCKIELGDHQRFTLKWCIISSFILLIVGLCTAVIPLG